MFIFLASAYKFKMPMRALENYSENAPKSINFTVEIDFIHINFTHKLSKNHPILL